jgi:uncharacterized protein with GYD domain
MALFLMLTTWTDLGRRNLKDRPKRFLERNPDLYRQFRIERKAQFFLNGPFDVLTLFDAPSEEVLSTFLLRFAMEGNVRRTIVRAFSWEEYQGFLNATGSEARVVGGQSAVA